jgi:hypothetical protein
LPYAGYIKIYLKKRQAPCRENNIVLKNYGYHLEHNFGHGKNYAERFSACCTALSPLLSISRLNILQSPASTAFSSIVRLTSSIANWQGTFPRSGNLPGVPGGLSRDRETPAGFPGDFPLLGKPQQGSWGTFPRSGNPSRVPGRLSPARKTPAGFPGDFPAIGKPSRFSISN